MEENRRNRLDLMTPAELSILNAIQEVEKVGADVKLTDVIVKLGNAKDCLSDYIDGTEEKAEVKRELTLGEKRVRTEFNPSGVGNVNFIKENSAKLINVCEELRPKPGEFLNPEKLRLIALAQTAYEEAAMWAVKAVTF